MRNILLLSVALLTMTSCFTRKAVVIPKAISTMGKVDIKDLNMEREDYQIINTVTAEATVSYQANHSGTRIIISSMDDDFKLDYKLSKKKQWKCSFSGILKSGYLDGNNVGTGAGIEDPAEIAHRLAVYRLINMVKVAGGDGVLSPVIQTQVEQDGKAVFFRTTATAKAVKLKAD